MCGTEITAQGQGHTMRLKFTWQYLLTLYGVYSNYKTPIGYETFGINV